LRCRNQITSGKEKGKAHIGDPEVDLKENVKGLHTYLIKNFPVKTGTGGTKEGKSKSKVIV